MPRIEGTSELMGVGAEAGVPAHTARYPVSYGAGGYYRYGGVSGTMAASLAANAELFQFRYVTAASRLALLYKLSISIGCNVAATGAALVSLLATIARAWTAAGSGGTRVSLAGDNNQLRTLMTASEVNDIGISTTAGLTAGTKTLDGNNMGAVAIGIGTGAITTSASLVLLPKTALFDADGEGQHPLVLANQEGFIIRNGANAWPAGMTWHFAVEALWAEVPAF